MSRDSQRDNSTVVGVKIKRDSVPGHFPGKRSRGDAASHTAHKKPPIHAHHFFTRRSYLVSTQHGNRRIMMSHPTMRYDERAFRIGKKNPGDTFL